MIRYLFACLIVAHINIICTPIRYLTPPRLDAENIGKKIICYRPTRAGRKPQLKIETRNEKTVVHNYGHGGNGWSSAPGCAHYTVSLLEATDAGLTKTSPVAIIGAGVNGLFTAYELVQRGYTQITIIAAETENLTSHNAAGLFLPTAITNDEPLQELFDRIGIYSYFFYQNVALGNNPILHGAQIVPFYTSRPTTQNEPPKHARYVGKAMEPAQEVIVDFGNGMQREMIVYDDGIFMNSSILMHELACYLEGKVQVKQEKIESFDAVDELFIFNCTGLGSAQLCNDEEFNPVQGHLIMLKDQEPGALEYMIGLSYETGKSSSGKFIERQIYVFPKQLWDAPATEYGVIGGTFIPRATAETPHEEEFDLMVRNHRSFFGLD